MRTFDYIHPIDEMERVSADELGEKFDEILDKVEKEGYVLDPHTAVAYKVYKEHKSDCPAVILSTASPYKFTRSVYEALYDTTSDDEFTLMEKLAVQTNTTIPSNLKDLNKKI